MFSRERKIEETLEYSRASVSVAALTIAGAWWLGAGGMLYV